MMKKKAALRGRLIDDNFSSEEIDASSFSVLGYGRFSFFRWYEIPFTASSLLPALQPCGTAGFLAGLAIDRYQIRMKFAVAVIGRADKRKRLITPVGLLYDRLVLLLLVKQPELSDNPGPEMRIGVRSVHVEHCASFQSAISIAGPTQRANDYSSIPKRLYLKTGFLPNQCLISCAASCGVSEA
jgi:hypothetical protein